MLDWPRFYGPLILLPAWLWLTWHGSNAIIEELISKFLVRSIDRSVVAHQSSNRPVEKVVKTRVTGTLHRTVMHSRLLGTTF
uniref:Putative secreted protein n=1 Tax=Anopheles darlingi TaxID=43151 RepID=A0A2M4DHQ6_ANODA